MPQQSYRTSNMHASPGGVLPTATSKEDLRNENSLKAYKILGTADGSLNENHPRREDKRRSRRPSFMRAPEIKSQKTAGFVPFPVATQETLPPQHLRVRASSPLLGHDYRPEDASEKSFPAPSKKVHQAGSTSALFSYFSSRESTIDSNPGPGIATSDFSSPASTKSGPQQNGESNFGPRQPKGPLKESKRKMRPPRIDLSLLFPKPRANAEPLLSPQRMVNSPSAISVVSENPVVKTQPESHDTAKKLMKTPPRSKGSTRMHGYEAHELSTSHESRNSSWSNPSLERTVPTSEIDEALQKYSNVQQSPQRKDKSRSSRLYFVPHTIEKSRTRDSNPTDNNAWRASTQSSASGWSKETYLSPRTYLRPSLPRVPDLPDHRQTSSYANASGGKDAMLKKSSRTTLKNADLNNSSVLCLSSSEDEDEDDEDFPRESQAVRGSVQTYGEFEPEICTASQATKGTVRSVDWPIPSNRSRSTQRHHSAQRDTSVSSAGRSSAVDRSQSRASEIPTISEPEFFHGDPIFSQARNSVRKDPGRSQKEANRRSRVIAVTRQEEHLLEAMRLRQGKITPSIFQEARSEARSHNQELDQGSMLSVPSRDSFYGSDMSFLRLSPAFPTKSTETNSDREGSVSRSTFSDAEQRTINSFPSPRTSVAYSTVSSPASGASPLTPTLPIHRFSPLPSQKPPPRHAPPAAPREKRRHSRRRTDSSEAIVLEESDDTKQSDELPVWSLKWNHETGTMTAVH
ncbi:hypothetical protein BO70DRAFT_286882 [Aspergillus heteromorphus CBS 117.55]|uniref:Uncharacterized protein n=1 Tax=Aspergillus heteromorphus CBS 117.55 TaxID=1448321 RepID=A0A317WPH2_9EURO|nr:uncharacterized protein BO70DRAFT_286882 [Aspergillus heteromorphus CBS 117.55]PWY88404.1 hypothetical protein BO70DRAFT_286882 [Aspergillus heteromorphus CBS 117.55]